MVVNLEGHSIQFLRSLSGTQTGAESIQYVKSFVLFTCKLLRNIHPLQQYLWHSWHSLHFDEAEQLN